MGGRNAFGTFDKEAMVFHPDDRSVGKYDNADGHASKSFWDEKTSRRIMWSWISGKLQSPRAPTRVPLAVFWSRGWLCSGCVLAACRPLAGHAPAVR